MKMTALLLFAFVCVGHAQTGTETHGYPNFAYLYCRNHGGATVDFTATNGQSWGLCELGDALIAAADLYVGRTAAPHRLVRESVRTFFRTACTPRAAAETPEAYCLRLGGHAEIFSPRPTRDVGLCIFTDQSAIGLSTLTWGYNDATNAALKNLLVPAGACNLSVPSHGLGTKGRNSAPQVTRAAK